MSRTQDIGVEGHINGDADGLGCARGVRFMLLLEAAAIAAFGIGLYFFWGS